MFKTCSFVLFPHSQDLSQRSGYQCPSATPYEVQVCLVPSFVVSRFATGKVLIATILQSKRCNLSVTVHLLDALNEDLKEVQHTGFARIKESVQQFSMIRALEGTLFAPCKQKKWWRQFRKGSELEMVCHWRKVWNGSLQLHNNITVSRSQHRCRGVRKDVDLFLFLHQWSWYPEVTMDSI